MFFSSPDANLTIGRERHNQHLTCIWLFKIYFYFFTFVLVIFYVHFHLINFFLCNFRFSRHIIYWFGYMWVWFPCLKCNRSLAKNHKVVRCDICHKWIHIACSNSNTYTYKELQKDKSPWYFICCLQEELPYCSIGNDVLSTFMHGSWILSPNPKYISSVIKQNEYFDEEILKKVNTKHYTQTKFNDVLNDLSTKKTLLALKYIFSILSPLGTL